ncbi:bifunctional proline dehydrogenase/L-glutamate gamma-semialdehyde dehydrogenase PutA [Lutimaribacter sp. EGI FJ00015]|uniref:Bifunctional proline dehydrogenase/L-glutamate gamma-semialdehyde dehydrogenase PutA n=1 Tax=Lutimaribacter degradans TaxID=2945989 RepID=A0ACC5ZSJ7_9RHOB|nr:bifunctional proline dehydrogenase/L-glutamate gamma-semialdehyde dehydrogenase PutA [Lutimaribacter sp. EGI FJ00013]MCM2560928.1 bifunctional proline dehydrogenase/L-glutamate gamma-semialdehyde dehydrogenase PutA [Lutimaribacter sp. EGI FJ00013]MCO0612126.1 bifunctional proline dehydrogenase/L-glutamate gamma-semialdehyde dehydrogenase PutA [Lutimaribacter sp. EGI FJ00015]MCO0634754.1 bifunctional proline dehydrogenase/L-glutamate gamma-semialdehyde dehydrogenase PutA [Lutimaribacter sp. EG
MSRLDQIRQAIRTAHHASEETVLQHLQADHRLDDGQRAAAHDRARALVEGIRGTGRAGLMEVFLAEYGLSTKEGVALMCLAEALLRVPDRETIDDLIEDKIAPSEWGAHLGRSSSSLVNASTWALMLTGRVLKEDEQPGIANVLHGAVKRLGEPVIRSAVARAMKEMGHQFVLGRDIDEAVKRGAERARQGYGFSYDMLGEAALTAQDAQAYKTAYADAIRTLAAQCASDDVRDNPGISIKLSALHPRYEVGQRDRVMTELVDTTLELALMARKANMGLNIDAEEADRLDLSLDVIEAVLRDPRLVGWDGFGVVVQAYGKRAGPVLDWLHALAETLDRKLMVRLVKGAYWDTEVKRAQVEGLDSFPVFTRKPATDVSFLCCARKLMGMTGRIYPQFATHNAHSVAAILEMTDDRDAFEFQRLHGMGESLHDLVMAQAGTRCRIYAPVGAHRDLLAYLVRRLLENGANSSFVNQIVDEEVPPAVVAADPFEALQSVRRSDAVRDPTDLFRPERANSRGFDLHDARDLARIEDARAPFAQARWQAGPLLAGDVAGGAMHQVINPARPDDVVGQVTLASGGDVDTALAAARPWGADAANRADVLNRLADLYEENFGEIFAVVAREAGKTPADAVAELREAVDFLRYYAARGKDLSAGPRGIFTCISPWNFPLAIFTGQIAAALAAGNAVLAKPAEATMLTAHVAVRLMHRAGVPRDAIQLLPGHGRDVGAALAADRRVNGVCFTGSTDTAQAINRAMARHMAADAPLIAETGGLNAMIVDSTALPEQAVRDIVASAFQSAGQRCSALRCLYVQHDIAPRFLAMLYGAMDELRLGDPWHHSTDVGPVIDARAQADFAAYIEAARAEGRVLKRLDAPEQGHFIGPAAIRVDGIGDLTREVFGPVLHIATFRAEDLDAVVDAVNASGYGLTFGLHTRIDGRVEQVTSRLRVGNAYVNRNQIGAVVGSQPFGGEGLSGTGPKAGGPHYVPRFARTELPAHEIVPGQVVDKGRVQAWLDRVADQEMPRLSVADLPGPTGESNRLSVFGRGPVLCLGPTAADAEEQARLAHKAGCPALRVAPGAASGDGLDGVLPREALTDLQGAAVVALWSRGEDLETARRALAARDGALIPLAVGPDGLAARCRLERHICIDTTAAGGNAALLAAEADQAQPGAVSELG